MINNIVFKFYKVLNKKSKFLFYGAIMSMTFVTFLEVVGLGGIFVVISMAESPEIISKYDTLSTMQSLLGDMSTRDFSLLLCFLALFLYVVKNLVRVVNSYLQHRFASTLRVLICRRIMDWYIRRPITDHLRSKPTSLAHTIMSVSEDAIYLGLVPFVVIITETLALAAIGIVALYAYPLYTLIFFIILAGVPGIIYIYYIRPKIQRVGLGVFEARHKLQNTLFHCFGALKEIKSARRELFFLGRFEKHLTKSTNLRVIEGTLQTVLPPFIELLVAMSLIGMAAAHLVYSLPVSASLPMLTLFAAVALRMLPAIYRIANALHFMSYASTSVGDIMEQFEKAIHFGSRDAATETLAHARFEEMRLDNVSFSYSGDETAFTLRDIDMTIKRGEIIALVGPSGSGKTTLADMILGLFTPTKGRLLLNGNDAGQQGATRANLSYIPQDIYLLDESIRQNIAFGLPEEEIDDEQILWAVKAANLTDDLKKLPDGVNTLLGERGVGLSGGQKQRIAIARALYNNADILILDEATASLDSESEDAITNTVMGLRGKTTCVVIAHRLSTVQNCDRLYYIEDGSIRGEGTFLELQQKLPRFSSMIQRSQLNSEDS